MAGLPLIAQVFIVYLSIYSFGNAALTREVDDQHPTFALKSYDGLNIDHREIGINPEKSSFSSGIAASSYEASSAGTADSDVGEQDETISSSGTEAELEYDVEPRHYSEDVVIPSSLETVVDMVTEGVAMSQTSDEIDLLFNVDNASEVVVPATVDTRVESETRKTEELTWDTNKIVVELKHDEVTTNKEKEPKEAVLPDSLNTLFGLNDSSLATDVPAEEDGTASMDGITVFSERAYEGKICSTLLEQEAGEIVMPEGPLDPSCKAWSWTVTVGDGYYADVTVMSLDVNHKVNEFMIIGPGSSMSDLWDDDSNPILTSTITTPKKFRILQAASFSVLLVTNTPSGFKGGFKLTYERAGKLSTTPLLTTPAPTLPTPAENITTEIQVFLRGLTPKEFGRQKVEFQKVVAEMANIYCIKNNIEMLEESTSKNVVLSLITQCDITWPDSYMCVKVNMSVAVITPDSDNPDSFELTAAHLQDMWDQHARENTGLIALGLNVYDLPNPETSLYLWLGVSLGVLVIFIVILMAVWRIDIFKDYSRMDGKRDSISHSQRSSTASNNSWFPSNEHQLVPPFMDIYSGTGYVEYEPEFDGPAPVPKYNEPTVRVTSATDFGPAPSYGPPAGFGGAIHFFSNVRSDFDNQAFVEDDDIAGDMTLDEEVNTDADKASTSGILKKTANSSC